jgi:ABC-type Fe3+-hydroxamate transport system substrate-binding protein
VIRVVSLVPSVTETLLAWSVMPVGVTRFCPAAPVAKVGGTKNPDLNAIQALAPDVVVMDKEENRVEDAESLEQAGLELLVTHVRSVADVEPTLDRLAEAVAVERSNTAALAPSNPAVGVRVWAPIWRRPWMTISRHTYGGSLLDRAGLENVFGDHRDAYPTVTLEDAAGQHPHFVLAPSEPYPFKEKHRVELEAVAPAVLVDGQDLFWWGSRTAGALGRLTELATDLRDRQVSRPT